MGYSRNTGDLDIWIAPTNENKLVFIQTLLCMNYSESEIDLFMKKILQNHLLATIPAENLRLIF